MQRNNNTNKTITFRQFPRSLVRYVRYFDLLHIATRLLFVYLAPIIVVVVVAFFLVNSEEHQEPPDHASHINPYARRRLMQQACFTFAAHYSSRIHR